MKFVFLSLIFLLPSFAQAVQISPTIVKESALKFHPTILSALENVKAAEESITGARGVFDTRIVSDYRRQTKGDYRNTVSRSFLLKPIPAANSKIYAGL